MINIVIANGASLKGFDFNRVCDTKHKIFCCNEGFKYLPRYDVWYSEETAYYMRENKLQGIDKTKKNYLNWRDEYRMEVPDYITKQPTRSLPNDRTNLNFYDDYIFRGNSGWGLFQLAFKENPSKLLVLGLDLSGTGHFYNDNSNEDSFNHLPSYFKLISPPDSMLIVNFSSSGRLPFQSDSLDNLEKNL